jgi:uncharacterized protein YPO0396
MTADLELGLFDEEQTGFRLQRLQVYNWGTFHHKVWTLPMDGRNGLLTGDIGSGKSTLVDAITTLLVPPQHVSYNKAAGAQHRERTAASYVLGHYKSESSELGVSAKPVALRGMGDYSVLLAVFANEALNQTVTLAQVLWFKDHGGQPARFYTLADRAMSIEADFSDFEDIVGLRKRFRSAGVEVMDSFSTYSKAFRRRFGIKNAQAMDLFHQTVSMKSVGNLTDFVRKHMLEPSDVRGRIDDLIVHFEDLNRAHEAVLDAKRQVGWLTPLVGDLDAHDRTNAELARLAETRDFLPQFYANLKLDLLGVRHAGLAEQADSLSARLRAIEIEIDEAETDEQTIKESIHENGGERISRLDIEIKLAIEQRNQRRQRSDRFATQCQVIGLVAARSADEFIDQQQSLPTLVSRADDRLAQIDNEANESYATFLNNKQELDEATREQESLGKRDTNIDESMVALRSRLCEDSGLSREELPFVGELLQVRDRDWESAAERLLHSFGLSLLVPDRHYSRVSAWVDDTNLRGRLVYYRVRQPRGSRIPAAPESLVHKLAVKPGSELSDWLAAEVERRFDLECADTPEQFRKAERAISKRGQLKFNRERHEKDDRHPLGDRRRYVLGWDNSAKRKALATHVERLAGVVATAKEASVVLSAERRDIQERKTAIGVLQQVRDFAEIDWPASANKVASLETERKELRDSSDILRSLNDRLTEISARLSGLRQSQIARNRDLAVNEEQIGQADELARRLKQRLVSVPEITSRVSDRIQALHDKSADGPEARSGSGASVDSGPGGDPEPGGDSETDVDSGPTVEQCDFLEEALRTQLQAKSASRERKLRRLADKVIAAMTGYRERWPLESQEFDASLQAGGEWRTQLSRLVGDDLPRFEANFKRMLNENAIREIVSLQNGLLQKQQQVKKRVATINESLRGIDYQPETYVRLEAHVTQDADVRDFQQQLRACTGDVLGTQDDSYAEPRFLQVKEIVDRFRGREGRSEEDKRWTARVTDVRNWFAFAASERLRSDDSEHEHYSDSGGKSGGQKEKLAYTILAASLAYQFGLVANETKSQTFRFVVIDEAFGRGSDESARFGLELFERLRLQLLVVTPLQKIHIIEPFVSNVGFVHSQGGDRSKLRSLTITQYRAELERARSLVAASDQQG